MPLNLRNAFLRGWFAARADRELPQPDDLPEKTFIDRGYEAGIASGGHALPMLENPESDAPSLSGVDFDAVLEAYRARKIQLQSAAAGVTSGASGTPQPVASISDLSFLEDASASDVVEHAAVAPSVGTRKSRWDDDDEGPGAIAGEAMATNPGRKRRYGN